jgi:hypothetical protein
MEKKPKGRPRIENTLTPMWKEIILDAGKEGKHITQFLNELGISWEGHYKLMDRRKDYNEAVQEYERLCENFWYNMAYNSMITNEGKNFNARLWSLIVRNKFPKRWSESQKIDISSMGEKISENKIEVEIIKRNIEDEK